MTTCVQVSRADGEATRQRLAEAGILDHGYEIVTEAGNLYIPVTDAESVPDDLTVVSRELPIREGQETPAELLGWEPSYERLGDIVIIDEDDPERADAIAAAIMASDVRAKTVVDRASKIKGTERLRDWDVVAGNGTETVHREYGHEYHLDIDSVYFSPRLATERHRVAEQVREGEHAFDMFAGVGPFVIPFAASGAICVGVDVNPDAIAYLEENAERNGVTDRITAINGDVREVTVEWADWADRLVMNLPHSAASFLDTAVSVAGDSCILHYYDIQPTPDPFDPGEAAIRAAAEPEYEVTVERRREVRSYAPHEVNVCLDVKLERS